MSEAYAECARVDTGVRRHSLLVARCSLLHHSLLITPDLFLSSFHSLAQEPWRMKLTDLRLWPIEVTCRDVPATFGTPNRRHVVVRLTTGDGVVGWGEMTGLSAGGPLAPDLDRLEAALRRELIGVDARDLRVLNERLRRWLGEDGVARQVRCGLDLALIDLLGRARGEPAWRLPTSASGWRGAST
jgi:hypothetical protein